MKKEIDAEKSIYFDFNKIIFFRVLQLLFYYYGSSAALMNSPNCSNNDIDALEIQIIEIVLYLNTNLHSVVYFFSCSDS